MDLERLPIDVLWMRISRPPGGPDAARAIGRFDRGRTLVMIYRGDYWQCASLIPKGGYNEVRRRRPGRPPLRDRSSSFPSLANRVERGPGVGRREAPHRTASTALRRWSRPGLLCIGDAAHAMSPVGGVGINLAIQDAVAAANLLAEPAAESGDVAAEDLRADREATGPSRPASRRGSRCSSKTA